MSMSKSIACTHCATPIAGDVPEAFVQTAFPDNVVGSLAVLQEGLGGVFCTACNRVTPTPMHHLVVGVEAVVLGLREARSAQFEQRFISALQRSVTATGKRLIHTNDPKVFRRSVISELLEPYGNVMNQFVASKGTLHWMEANEDKIDSRFFSAMWLTTTGAVPIFEREISCEESPGRAFVPDEIAPDDSRHLVRRSEAVARVEGNIGSALACLLTHMASRCVQERTLVPLTELLSNRVPAVVLTDEILTSAAGRIQSMSDNASEQQREGWITGAYLLEAGLALLCLAHGRINPRREQWSFWNLFYDWQRRLDGNDESVLLAVETVRRSVDAAAYWHHFRHLRDQIASETETESRERRFAALFGAAERVFADELQAQTHLETTFDARLSEAEAQQEVVAKLRDALRPPVHWFKARAIVAGACRTHPTAVLPAVAQIWEDAPGPDDRTLARLCVTTIEHLNLSGRPGDAARLLEPGLGILASLPAGPDEDRLRSQFYNEMGNCSRHRGRLAASQASYERALEFAGGDDDVRERRVILRNLAIVLRDQHRYMPAIGLFERLLSKAGSSEVPGLVTSLAICLSEAGMDARALALMEEYFPHLSGKRVVEPGVLEYVTQLALLLARSGRVHEARELLSDGACEEAARRSYHAAALTRRYVELQLGSHDRQTRERMLDEQHFVFANLGDRKLGVGLLAMLRGLNDALSEDGQSERAETLVRRVAGALDPGVEPRLWLLHCLAARHAERRKLSPAPDLEKAVVAFQRGIASAASTGDMREFASPQSDDVRDLVSAVLRVGTGDSLHAARLWRHAADVGAAPVLTASLRRSAGLAPTFDAPDEEDARLAALLAPADCTLLQVVASGDGLRFLSTSVGPEGLLRTEVVDPGIALAEAERVSRSLAFHLVRADPTAPELDLARLRNWSPFAARVRQALEGAAPARQVLIVAGPLSEPVLMLALAGTRPLSFVPSVAAATALRERRLRLNDARQVRRLFGFATWFAGERADEARALASVADHVRECGARHGIDVETASASEATRERLLQGLSGSDIAWIACHGRLRREAQSIELLVAAAARLPPSGLSMATDEGEHAVGWESLASLPRSPGLVVSSACDSGLSFTNLGGERLGLERALLPAGTHAFVAPLWPVPTVAIQSVVALLLDAWLEQPGMTWALHLHRMREPLLARGFPALAVDALAVFGELPS